MPDGVVQWFDPASGRASVVRAGRVYAAVVRDIEPVARHPGAHVHFDIRRDDGAERAVEVRLRAGTRVSHHQHRYGTLAGARRPDTKGPAPFAHPHPERGRALAGHPLEVARAWVDRLQARDIDGALSLYASDAVLHAGADDHAGRSDLGGYLEASPLFGIDGDPDIRGEDGTVAVRWARDERAGIQAHARVEHGLIAEQWVGDAPSAGRTMEVEGADGASIAVTVLTQGRVNEPDVDYAVKRVGAVMRRIDDPVLFARLKLGIAGDPARAKPALAQIALDVNGEFVRAHVAAHTMREAADLLQRHLIDRLDQRAQHRDDLRTRGAGQPGEWRHGDLAADRPGYYDRPADERELMRHKTFAIDELTPDEAAFDMVLLDYDFYLFRDLASGEDSVLERRGGGEYRLSRLRPTEIEPAPASIELTTSDAIPPKLTVREAMQLLDIDGEPFVFFANATTGRGNVIYRRYDGHYGLITPAQ